MRIPLDRDSPVPLYQQIEQFLREQIRSGTLAPETRLPASRDLAAGLGVNRLTITSAYGELEAQGLVCSRRGSGTYVAAPPPELLETARDEDSQNWPLWQQQLFTHSPLQAQQELDRLLAPVSHPDLISLAGGAGDAGLFSLDDFRKALQHVLRRDDAGALSYGDRPGISLCG